MLYICNMQLSPEFVAQDIFDFANFLIAFHGVSFVTVCDIFTRPSPRYIAPTQYVQRRHSDNAMLRSLIDLHTHIMFWPHRRIYNIPLSLRLLDGCHLNRAGLRKFYRSIRLAIIHACRRLTTLHI